MPPVYTRRLSGPQPIEQVIGTTLHVSVPAGRVYVVRQMLVVNTNASLSVDVRVTLMNAASSFASVFGLVVPASTSIARDVLLPLVAGEALHVYGATTAAGALCTFSGYDFLDE